MLRFVLGRAVALLGTVLFAALAVFLLLTVIPGDAARLVVGPEATPEAYRAAREALGLDRPWPARFGDWLGQALRGDLGMSWVYPRPVSELLVRALSVTLPLALLAIAVASILGLGVGILASSHLGRAADLGLMALAQIGIAVPEFWVGILLMGWFAVGWRILPSGGFPGWGEPGALAYLVLPALALSLPRGAYLARMVRAAVADVLSSDAIRTARAKGLPERRVILVHALRGALVPVAAAFGLTFARLMAGTLVIENVFSLPGVGWYAVRAANGRDLYLLLGIAVTAAALVGLVSAGADLAYAFLNPRIRYR
ncbi:MAG: ABC transporter permease [Candidatus Bipolaricaulis sp.]|nr:ABC transporter permease [Candidatus Bipolaricaulis sp.]